MPTFCQWFWKAPKQTVGAVVVWYTWKARNAYLSNMQPLHPKSVAPTTVKLNFDDSCNQDSGGIIRNHNGRITLAYFGSKVVMALLQGFILCKEKKRRLLL